MFSSFVFGSNWTMIPLQEKKTSSQVLFIQYNRQKDRYTYTVMEIYLHRERNTHTPSKKYIYAIKELHLHYQRGSLPL
jgi:hypothetical protein